jgi:hypothetical protein
VQQIFNAGCNVQEYYKMQRNFPFPKPPDKCPNCGKYCRMKKQYNDIMGKQAEGRRIV